MNYEKFNENFIKCLKMQKSLDEYISKKKNIVFNNDFEIIKNNIFLAMISEIAEIQDCFYWKHWKKEHLEKRFMLKETKEHLQEEIIDFFHFLLQINYFFYYFYYELIEKGKVNYKIYNYVFTKEEINKTNNIVSLLRELISIATAIKDLNYYDEYSIFDFLNNINSIFFYNIIKYFDYDYELFFNKYFEKNKINFERQDNNY